MLSCSIWFSVPSLWMDDGLESRCVGRVNGADGAIHTIHTTYTAAGQEVFLVFLIVKTVPFQPHSTLRLCWRIIPSQCT